MLLMALNRKLAESVSFKLGAVEMNLEYEENNPGNFAEEFEPILVGTEWSNFPKISCVADYPVHIKLSNEVFKKFW